MKYYFTHGWGIAVLALGAANLAWPFFMFDIPRGYCYVITVVLVGMFVAVKMGADYQRVSLRERLAWSAFYQVNHNQKDFGQPTDQQVLDLQRRVQKDPEPSGRATFVLSDGAITYVKNT